ncbi:uncharacterized protein [Musca autumnalis]|uniref:uncharacterized protein n=1 Tax=Musca autumnalis TaxID=221902 RepID=UPI003CF1D7F8
MRFTNLVCKDLRPDFSIFEVCRLTVIKRDIISLNINVKLLKGPVNNATLNGYKPYLINTTYDFCKFMQNRNRYKIAKLFLDAMLKESNVNHTCPYEVNLALFKKVNGYKPFLYNTTIDFCMFMTNRNKFKFAKIFQDILMEESNLNHTCPFDHNLIVDNLILDERKFAFLPLPRGDYMFMLKVAAYNDWKALVKVYISIDADL